MKAKPRALGGLCFLLPLLVFLCASCAAAETDTSGTGSTSSTAPAPAVATTPTTATTPSTVTEPSTAPAPSTVPEPIPTTSPISSAGALLSLLAGIPEDPISRADAFIYFADYAAMESAYDATRPADAQQAADISASDQAHRVWWVVFENSWSFSRYWLASLDSGPEMVGFSPLEVDQAIQFGVAPGDGLMLAGRFDADAVRSAYQANLGLVPRDFDGTTVMLWGEDPADGFRVDVANVVRENPFGGQLGRRQPMIIRDDLLMSSADLELVLAHAGAAARTQPSLADVPGYRAVVDAVGRDADVLQAAIAGPTAALNIAQTSPRPSGDDRLPAFELLMLADVVTGEEQIARLGLVYRDAGSAETAGSVLLGRLAAGPRYYVQQGPERAVLVLEFPAPRATSVDISAMLGAGSDKGTATRPGSVYGRILNMFLQRDTSWLSAQAVQP